MADVTEKVSYVDDGKSEDTTLQRSAELTDMESFVAGSAPGQPAPERGPIRTIRFVVSRARPVFSVFLLLGLCIVLAVASASALWVDLTDDAPGDGTLASSIALPTPSIRTSLRESTPIAAERARQYVVLVSTARGSGSGIVLSKDGYILTCEHVIHGALRVEVRVGGYVYSGSVVKSSRRTDLAVLRIRATGLQPAVWADSDGLDVGQEVVAIGHPLAMGKRPPVSYGAVVARRTLHAVDYIQTDAVLNNGVSGGGLVDSSGAVVGVTAFSITDRDGPLLQDRHFAIASNYVRRWIEGLEAN